MDHALAVLQQLGAINQEDEVTPLGQHLVRLRSMLANPKLTWFAVDIAIGSQTWQGNLLSMFASKSGVR